MAGDVTLEDVWKLFQATDAQIKATGAQIKATDAQIKATDEKITRFIEEGNRRHAETEAAFQELARKLGKLSDRIGEFAEGMVIPAARTLFAERGIEVHKVSRHVEARYGDNATEFDILIVNARHVVAIEVKSRLKVPDVSDHVERMASFKNFFPEYADRIMIGAVAGMVVDDEAGRFAYRQGLFVLAQTGDTVTILNDARFRPKAW